MAPSKKKTLSASKTESGKKVSAGARTKSVAKSQTHSNDPFKTKRSSSPAAKQAENVVSPSPEVSEAVDAFRSAQDQAKYYEGEASVHKNTILNFASEEYAKRLYMGDGSGFKIQGVETMAMYVVQDASAGISEEELEEFSERWGEEAAENLIVRDYASIRFNDAVLEANYDAVVKALQTLPHDVLDNLFKPMSMRARPGAADLARRHVKKADELRDILRHLKLRHYIR